MYINDENALRIDFARNITEDWRKVGFLSDDEYYYLVACIVEGIPFVSNISGTYGAFHKEWERRSYKKYELLRLPICTNGKNNTCFNGNGADVLKEISGDILYIDPPYNERQYLPNYHVLETAAKYDFPEVRGITAQRAYENNKSDFCSKTKVVGAFEELIANARFNHIILSYSTDGLMSVEEIEREVIGPITSPFLGEQGDYINWGKAHGDINDISSELRKYINDDIQLSAIIEYMGYDEGVLHEHEGNVFFVNESNWLIARLVNHMTGEIVQDDIILDSGSITDVLNSRDAFFDYIFGTENH